MEQSLNVGYIAWPMLAYNLSRQGMLAIDIAHLNHTLKNFVLFLLALVFSFIIAYSE